MNSNITPELNDDLADLFNLPAGPVKKIPQVPMYASEERGFVEPCASCHGSKYFISSAGRIVGPCFKCKGTGKKVYRTSKATRENAVALKARREEEASQANLAAFAAANPAIWAWMDGNSFSFAVSMREAVAKYGSLTENQTNAAMKCIEKVAAFAQEAKKRVENAPEISVEKIMEAFDSASATLKNPRLTIAGFKFSLAKVNSANAGAVYVKSGEEYLGKIMSGKFVATRACDTVMTAQILKIANDPKEAAIAHGRMTGNCACCGRELTNKASVELGIGPICAGKFGW